MSQLINIENIHEVKEFAFKNNELFILTNRYIKFGGIEIKGEFRCITFWEDYLLYQNLKGNNIIIYNPLEQRVIKVINGAREYGLWFLDKYGKIPVDDKVMSLNPFLELIETNSVFSTCSNGIYNFNRFKNSVKCTYVSIGEIKWILELGEGVKVNGDFYLFNQIIVVPISNNGIVGINIETGKELWRLANINANSFQIQPKTNYLISLDSNSIGDNWYYVISPTNGQIIVDKKFDCFYYGAGGSQACIDDNHYYFISNTMGFPKEMRTEKITHLGCINLQTHEIEWMNKIGTTSDKKIEYQKLEVHDGKIYLLDEEKTLHIYKIE